MGIFWLQSCREIARYQKMKMTVKFQYLSAILAVMLLAGCSTMSRTEKQLAKVDSFDYPDIPSPGMTPPMRPVDSGLIYSRDVLIISYDEEIGKEPLKKAVRKHDAEIIYDYRMINALAVRIPDPDRMDESVAFFSKVKGVLRVSRDQMYRLDPVRPVMEVR